MPTDYSKGKIYAIRSYQTKNIYIGSTCQDLHKRLYDHKRQYKRYLYKQNVDYYTSFEILKYPDVYIELIQEIPCINKMELCKYEGQYIRTMKCVNKHIPGRTLEEWNTDNGEYRKTYYDNNRLKILKQKKEYSKKKYKCACGSSCRFSSKQTHFRTKNHRLYIFNLHNELNHL